jgi:hypothetical protein
MLQLKNHTPFQCSLAVFPSADGVECAYGVVKATFALKDGTVAPEKAPIVPVDEHWGEPGASSLKYAAEMTLTKPGTDVLLLGHAYAPGGRTREMEVTLKVGALAKTVRVFGNRTWKSGLLGYKISEPEPFEKVPLKYELAFGGTDPNPRDPKAVDYEPRNPVGRGLVPKNSQLSAEGIALPNLEDPRQLIAGLKDRPAPACFAPTCGHWEPRKSYAGTYDQAWTKKRAPYLPVDFDPRFFQCALPDLIAKEYLRGGEPVEITGASPAGPLVFTLPVCALELVFHLDGKAHRHVPKLDTVVFEPDAQRFWMVWRACQLVDKKLLRLSELEVICPQYPKRKAA